MKNFESIFAAYLIAWGVFFVYQVSIARRMAQLADELERLKDIVGGRR